MLIFCVWSEVEAKLRRRKFYVQFISVFCYLLAERRSLHQHLGCFVVLLESFPGREEPTTRATLLHWWDFYRIIFRLWRLKIPCQVSTLPHSVATSNFPCMHVLKIEWLSSLRAHLHYLFPFNRLSCCWAHRSTLAATDMNCSTYARLSWHSTVLPASIPFTDMEQWARRGLLQLLFFQHLEQPVIIFTDEQSNEV